MLGSFNANCTNEIGVVLFNYGDQGFEVKMGNRIAKLILQKIDTPKVMEVQRLEEFVCRSVGFGGTGVNEKNDTKKTELECKNELVDEKEEEMIKMRR